jgi:predicted DNA-binding protein
MSTYTVQRQVRLSQDTAKQLKAIADKRGKTVSDVIREAIFCEIYKDHFKGETK